MSDYDLITTSEAAEITGYHINYIRQLIKVGKVDAQKFGPIWQVSRSSLLSYMSKAQESDDSRRGPKT